MERRKSLKLQKVEVILRRLRKAHASFPMLEHDHAKMLAGYKGEKSIDYFLSYINEDYYIFNNIRLSDRNYFFQIDTLIISPFFICILEVKNIAGTIFFDDVFDQMIRSIDGKDEGFSSPVIQVRRQRDHLKHWLVEQKFLPIPVETLIVISNPSTIIKSSKIDYPQVIHSANIPLEIKRLEAKYNKKIIPKQSLKKLAGLLFELNTEDDTNVLYLYKIERKEIVTGVQCQNCGNFDSVRRQGFWRCSICTHKSKYAHIQSLEDYKLIFGEKITNQKLRSFLHITSRTSATKLLRSLNFSHEGKTKGRVYIIE